MLKHLLTFTLAARLCAALQTLNIQALQRGLHTRLAAAEPQTALERGAVLRGAVVAVISAVVPLSAHAAAAVDYQAVAADIAKIIKSDADKGPTFLRLSWHSSGDYSKQAGDGGSRGGTIRFKEELAHGGNAGLAKAVQWLEPVKKAHPGASYADIFTLAGVVAIKEANGPIVPWSSGRVDEPVSAVAPDGRLPAADKGSPAATAKGLRDGVFYRMGFDDREIVALSGAHALGRCHPDASGYDGPWTPTPTLMNNGYYSLLLNVPWTPRQWDGPAQFEDPSGKLMMLPSDLLLITDKKFRKYTEAYAKDNALFLKDFSAAFQKLEENGCTGLTPTAWA